MIAVSEATKQDFLRYYPVDASRVRVVHHGVDERLFSLGREPEPFLLCVSTLHPHKNLERLVRAFAAFRLEYPKFRLVLAGMRGFHSEAVERQVAVLGLEDAVRITGWILREDLRDLYRRAHAFVYPSTFEGFGMPVLEALAAGVPTACSAIAPLREVAGDAAILFDPADDAVMLGALRCVVADDSLRTHLAAAGPERASEFSWRRAAGQTLEILVETTRGLRSG
ncbi:MAG: glycosyltransferase family 4 protein [bacterium]|nr:glycosyltransferase family 4 protein [bacterium]